jgi:hypothetical protein
MKEHNYRVIINESTINTLGIEAGAIKYSELSLHLSEDLFNRWCHKVVKSRNIIQKYGGSH